MTLYEPSWRKGTMSAGTDTNESWLRLSSLFPGFGTRHLHSRDSPLKLLTSQTRLASEVLLITNGDSTDTTLIPSRRATLTMTHPRARESDDEPLLSFLVSMFLSKGYRWKPTVSTGILAEALNKKLDESAPFGISKYSSRILPTVSSKLPTSR